MKVCAGWAWVPLAVATVKTSWQAPVGCDVIPARGWVESVEEREKGVASVSAPVHDEAGRLIAAVSVSGPIERTSRSPGRRYGAAVQAAARRVEGAARV